MRLMIRRFFSAFVFACALFSIACVKPAHSAEYPMVAGLQRFSPEANFMSLPGFLRFLVFQQNGIWLTHHESVAVVRQQQIEVGQR